MSSACLWMVLSKSHRICGFRVGWWFSFWTQKNVKGYIEGANMLANMRLCANVLSQHVIQTSLGATNCWWALLIPGGRIWTTWSLSLNNHIFRPLLSQMQGLQSFSRSDRGAWYWRWWRILFVFEEGEVPSSRCFNWNEPDHSIVYLPRVERVTDLGNKIERVLSYYKR